MVTISAASARVYPRVGGGTLLRRLVRALLGGLSPRGRGNRTSSAARGSQHGSIPAWAGEPLYNRVAVRSQPVYPRVGGGTTLKGLLAILASGLSPRGRGNPAKPPQSGILYRSIPAWAGEPALNLKSPTQSRVYPRVGGGTVEGGNTGSDGEGLSPRGRGNRDGEALRPGLRRSIPAWAGEPGECGTITGLGWVYPRVGGGTGCLAGYAAGQIGLSPRGRGNRNGHIRWLNVYGSIPAWAGEPRVNVRKSAGGGVYPRVGGGTICTTGAGPPVFGLSPRGRGNLHQSA